MMKKQWIAMLLAGLLVCSLSACGKKPGETDLPNKDPGTQNPPSSSNAGGKPSGDSSNDALLEPAFPDSLAKADAEVRLDDLISVLGRKEADLENAMKDVSTVGDSVAGARTYRHKLLGTESEVSYGIGSDGKITRITVNADAAAAEDWRTALRDTLRAEALENEMDAWHYSDADIRLSAEDGKTVIVIEKKPA